ncbi:hypothetical protein BDR26DRAFT_833402 [Obelidium mucronatum]|nr:hypothetical protein BDR26DRAFT_833402 [Obelidium mucronatum]
MQRAKTTTTTTTTTKSVAGKRSVTSIQKVSQISFSPMSAIEDKESLNVPIMVVKNVLETGQLDTQRMSNTPLPHVELEELSITHTFSIESIPHVHFFAIDGSNVTAAAVQAALDHGEREKLDQEIARELEHAVATFGATHPTSLKASNNLGAWYQVQELFDQATSILVAGVEAAANELGVSDTITLIMQTNLGFLYEMQGSYILAERVYANRVTACKEGYGELHVKTLEAFSDLAIAYRLQGKKDRAEHLHRKCLDVSTVVFGSDHVHTRYFQRCLDEIAAL